MSVKYEDATEEQKSALDRQSIVLIRMSLDEIHKLSTPKTPKKKGRLRRNIEKTMSGKTGVIIWKQPYAIYQEDKQFQNYTTPGTGPDFAKDAAEKVSKNTQLIADRAFLDWK